MSRRKVHVWRRGLLLGMLLVGGAAITARAVQLQIVEHDTWLTRAGEQHARALELPAPRGAIFDRDGVPLAVSQEVFRISVAPRELRDPDAAAERLQSVLGLSRSEAARAVDRKRSWVVLAGRVGAPVRERLEDLDGIYFERILRRFHPHGDIAAEILGEISGDGRALGGIEEEFDSILAGTAGAAVVRREASGEPIPGSTVTVLEPKSGRDLYLTIDYDLQEIAHEALRDALEQTGSEGGDLLLLDPWTGEILAAASQRGRRGDHWSGVTDPFEPGSTMKPFTVAALLTSGAAGMSDSVYAEDGRYTTRGRTITDVHGYGWLSVREALRVSSNVAMAKLSERLQSAAQYSVLRDFGFGTPTGVEYPAESAGLLRRPDDWSRYSPASLAIGYEVSVTPLQLALAYAALANGGTLMQPRLVREIHSPAGQLLREFEPTTVRRVIREEDAREIAGALVDVVREGTGTAASLENFEVAGKTGTARRVSEGGYQTGAYNSTFAGFFPAVDPQLVFLVKLDRPSGAYYGGSTAAPVTRATLAAALAARGTPIDRGAIFRFRPAVDGSGHTESNGVAADGPGVPESDLHVEPGPGGAAEAAGAVREGSARASAGPSHFVLALDSARLRRGETPDPSALRPVPELKGLSLRDAARRLHARGLRVNLQGSGATEEIRPSAGTPVPPNSVVYVRGRREAP